MLNRLTLEEAIRQSKKDNGFELKDKLEPNKKAGRPTKGKSKAINKIAFMIDDEQLNKLKTMRSIKEKLKTANAVAKKILLQYVEVLQISKIATIDTKIKKDDKREVGRPIQGKTKAINKIAFMVDDEQFEKLSNMIDFDNNLSSANSVAKKIVIAQLKLIEC